MNYETILNILFVGIICVLINMPFGMLRSRTKPYGILWFLCIHTPIPIAVIVRKALGLSGYAIIILLFFSIFGQIIGKKIAFKYFPPKKKTL